METQRASRTRSIMHVQGAIPVMSLLGALTLKTHNFPSMRPAISLIEPLRLQRVTQAYNKLSGDIPDGVASWTELRALFSSSNRLSGSIPGALSVVTVLLLFEVSNNRLSGCIPGALSSWTEIVKVKMNINQLRGPIPDSLSFKELLHTVLLGQNEFCA